MRENRFIWHRLDAVVAVWCFWLALKGNPLDEDIRCGGMRGLCNPHAADMVAPRMVWLLVTATFVPLPIDHVAWAKAGCVFTVTNGIEYAVAAVLERGGARLTQPAGRGRALRRSGGNHTHEGRPR